MGEVSTNPINAISELLVGEPQETPKETADVVDGESQVDTSEVELEDGIENGPSEDSVETPEELEVDPDNTPEEGDVNSLNDFAAELDVPVEDLYELNINMPNDEPITLGGLKDFYESNKDINEVRAGIDQQQQAMQAEMDALKAQPGLSNDILQARAQVLSIEDQYNKIDWNTLRAQNPGQYAAAQQDFHTQYDIAKQNERSITQQVDEHLETGRAIEQQKLLQAVPELKDAELREQISENVQTLAMKYGFTPDDVGKIEDHRLMRLLIDASKMNGAVVTAKKKLESNQAPTSTKSSPAKAVPLSTRKATLKALTDKARKSNDNRDKTSAITELLR